MNIIEIIKNQIISVKENTDNLIKIIDLQDWKISPKILETNMNWQIGHLILANYLHGIASISGANEKVRERINMQNFIKFYGPNSTPNMFLDEKPNNEELLKLYEFIFELIYLEINKVKIEELNNVTEIPNPSAKTKYEALTTLAKHQSWHNGQIAILNRILKNK
ncbi:hypothetical protein SY27_13545 [Flavobacterium sp. 316]|uniref:DinB family protein n=1 Tax=Flavobacterium sediminilitoris TaxID=2024526 RepID=A0ABY4HJU9_9FLAO|nr:MULTISPECIES: DinB family protein [Flavobacterium]KIX20170.1 hypothetical protein SY27_13545 [Flavobacterium sp. 316]UOX33134.1 DinB family protein [Flavobacterium sediminilitoris]